MSNVGYIRAMAIAVASLSSIAVQAQSASGHNHSAHQEDMDVQSMDSSSKTTQDTADPHAGHNAPQAAATPAAPMDHSSMQMQGGSAPPDARDPHAYSNGLKRGAGDYAVPGVDPLMLADQHSMGGLRGESFERQFSRKGDDATAYDLQGWYGTTYDRAVVKAEGEWAKGKIEDSRTDLLWAHAITAYWDTQLGVRFDGGEGPSRQWLAIGLQGLAPYWFEVDATAYVGDGGRTALRLQASYDFLLTQRLILEPQVEVQLYGKNDEERRIGRGLTDATVGLRLRYEFSRQFAPYIGIERAGSFGQTADYIRADGGRSQQTRFVAGVRFWF